MKILSDHRPAGSASPDTAVKENHRTAPDPAPRAGSSITTLTHQLCSHLRWHRRPQELFHTGRRLQDNAWEGEGSSSTRQRWVRTQGHERPNPSSRKWALELKRNQGQKQTGPRRALGHSMRTENSPGGPPTAQSSRSRTGPPSGKTNRPGTPAKPRLPRLTSACLQSFLLSLTQHVCLGSRRT